MLEVLLLSLIQNQSSLYIYVTSLPNRMLVISLLTKPLLIHTTHTCHLLCYYTLQCNTTQVHKVPNNLNLLQMVVICLKLKLIFHLAICRVCLLATLVAAFVTG